MQGLVGSQPLQPRVVSNTTPLIVLAGLQLLDILALLYREIQIPRIVYDEYQRGRKSSEPTLDSLVWLTVHSVAPHSAVSLHLDPGETAAISLALQTQAQLILLDENAARKEARRLRLVVTGSIGVLIQAKLQGHVPALAPLLDRMIAQGRYISPALRAQVLRDAGEDPGS